MTHNVSVEAPFWIATYERLAETLGDGYAMCIHEYTNDMCSRELLDRYQDDPTVVAMADRITSADEKIREMLSPTKKCIHGDSPRTHVWFWLYPPNSPELERDLREMGAI